MLIKLIEVKKELRGGRPSLSEIYINCSHIVSVTEDNMANETLVNEVKNLGLIEGISFSKIIVTEGSRSKSLTVVGAPSEVYSKIRKRQILKG
tara:strand:+ start:140 stop:418 length:279 start_codon:yes stop_codon:yes gene_type:complete